MNGLEVSIPVCVNTWYLAEEAVPVIYSPGVNTPLFIASLSFLSVTFHSLTYASVPESDPTTLSLKKYVPIPVEITVSLVEPIVPV